MFEAILRTPRFARRTLGGLIVAEKEGGQIAIGSKKKKPFVLFGGKKKGTRKEKDKDSYTIS